MLFVIHFIGKTTYERTKDIKSKRDRLWVRFLLEQIKYLILSYFPCSGV